MTPQQYLQALIGKHWHKPTREQGVAFAPVNIALAKYWGKRQATLNLPITNSLSIALPEKGAFTQVSLIDKPVDEIQLNGEQLTPDSRFAQGLNAFLNLLRPDSNLRFKIVTNMNVPAAAGLASSACGFAALTLAFNQLFDWSLSKQQLSMIARLGSGSAARSLWNGFVEWHAGCRDDGMDCYAEPLTHTWEDLRIGLLIFAASPKPISSRQGMQQTVATSCYYPSWPTKLADDLALLHQAIQTQDFELLGKTAESNALAMHASMLTAWPPVLYWQPETISLMQQIWQLRQQGLAIYFTQDAGPNLKLLFQAQDTAKVQQAFPELELITPFPSLHQQDEIILVEPHTDRCIGTISKLAAHQQALCHRAFSVFVFRTQAGQLELLLQQRHLDKYHCGGLWTNTCCSHPRVGEHVVAAAQRRLREEMGLDVELSTCGAFHYIAHFDNGLTENEFDHVLVGFVDDALVRAHPEEVADYNWIAVADLQQQLKAHPERYTPWLAKALAIALQGI